MNDISQTALAAVTAAEDITAEKIAAESGDYSALLAAIYEQQAMQTEQIIRHNELLAEQNQLLTDTQQVTWWIFFILAIYGLYKIFLGNILSWFNGV